MREREREKGRRVDGNAPGREKTDDDDDDGSSPKPCEMQASRASKTELFSLQFASVRSFESISRMSSVKGKQEEHPLAPGDASRALPLSSSGPIRQLLRILEIRNFFCFRIEALTRRDEQQADEQTLHSCNSDGKGTGKTRNQGVSRKKRGGLSLFLEFEIDLTLGCRGPLKKNRFFPLQNFTPPPTPPPPFPSSAARSRPLARPQTPPPEVDQEKKKKGCRRRRRCCCCCSWLRGQRQTPRRRAWPSRRGRG